MCMSVIKTKKGLNIPIKGTPQVAVTDGTKISSVAILGSDYVNMKPTLKVKVGDSVKLGQILFTDKKLPDINFTAPGAGKVKAINRGAKRVFQSLVIELEGKEEVTFESFPENKLDSLDRAKVKSILLESGQWVALRQRPFSKSADPKTIPNSIFITASDSNPLAPSMDKIVAANESAFNNGVKVISRLTDGLVYLCKTAGSNIPNPDLKNLRIQEFAGPHPSGNVGTHIHFLDPVSLNKTVWHIGLQDVIAIGKLFVEGKISTERIVALGGTAFNDPRMVRTRLGASVYDVTLGELKDGDNRVISGSVLTGHESKEPFNFLGRYHQQISAIAEGRKRTFFGWVSPGFNMFSNKNILASCLIPGKKFDFNTALHGGERAIVPVGSYEKVMPLDILPTFLLRALACNDIEEAEQLGCLELDEEDLALCTFVCQSKIDHGAALRRNLTILEKEG
ncbi:MAG: Na(+)-translocating NADH-quinone reductase subunit A [Candidatus Kapabacteria bacterium]|jgi:Na+-transporting NADH:ubiquinone oxidoreductase subunit A|nr:Na(+)-translocating NADH-quinone reductase subunit A [Candidatus Kapabacteria bacterium]